MQHPPTQPYQDSSDCEKRGCFLVSRTIHILPSDSLCVQTAVAFIFIRRSLRSNRLCLRKAFGFALPSKYLGFPSKGLSRQSAFAIEWPLPSKCPCQRRDFAFLCPAIAIERPFAFEAPLASKGLCHRSAFAALKGLRHRRDLPLPQSRDIHSCS